MQSIIKLILGSLILSLAICSCTSRKERELEECAQLDDVIGNQAIEYGISATYSCYNIAAEKYKDETICELIPDEITTEGGNTFNKNFFEKAWCFAGVAYAKEDIALCAKVEISNAPVDPVEECYYRLCKDACSSFLTDDSVRKPELCEALKQLDDVDCE